MSKREADEYITKEHGSIPNQSEGDKKKMATAAQLARRKMAVPRSRVAGRATTPTGSTSQSGNPFGPSQQQQTFQPVGGFTFGASQNSQPEVTGMQSSANGFTFSAGQPDSNPFNNVQLNNPFANTNGGVSNSFPPAYGGFGGSSMNTGKRSSDDMMLESPEKKQAGTHAFGRHQGFDWANPSQSQQQQPAPAPAFSFGSTAQNDKLANGSLFGIGNVSKPEQPQQQQPTPTPTPSFSFGNSQQNISQPYGGLIGSVSKPDQQEQQQPAPTPPPSFSFGSGQPSNDQSNGGLFGSVSKTDQPQLLQPAPTSAPSFSFGSSQPSNDHSNGGLFGGVSKPDQPKQQQPAPAPLPSFSFGSTPQNNNQANGGLFGSVSKPDQPQQQQQQQQQQPVPAPPPSFSFGSTPQSSNQTDGGLFGLGNGNVLKPVQPKQQQPAPAPTPSFSFGSTPQNNKEADGGLFGFENGNVSKPDQPPSSGGLFSPPAAKPSAPKTAEKPASSTSFSVPPAPKPPPLETVEKPASSTSFSAPPAPKTAPKPSSPAPAQSSTTEPSSQQRPVYTKSPGRIPNFLNGEGYKEYDNNFRLRALNREFQRRLAALDPARHDFENIIRHYVAARASIGADIGLYQRTMAGTKRKNDTIDEQELEVPQQYKKTKSNDGQASAAPASAPAPSQPVAKTNTFGSTSAPAQTFSSPAPGSKATSMFSQMIPKSPGKTSQPPRAKQTEPEKPVNVFASIPNPPPAGPSFIRNLVEEIENNSAPKGSGAPTFGNHIPSETPAKPSQGFTPANAPSTAPAKPPQEFVPSSTPAAKPPQGFVPASAPPRDLFAAFAAEAATNDKKRKAEILEDEYSSDEDSQAEGRKKLEEEDRAKRAKYDSIPKTGFTPNFQKSTSPSKSPPRAGFTPLARSIEKPISPTKFSPTKAKRNSTFQESDSDDAADDKEGEADDEETTEEKDGEFQPEDEESTEESEEGQEDDEDDLPEDDVQDDDGDDDGDREAEIEANPNKGKSLFDRVEANPDKPNDTPVNGDKNVRKSIESGFNFSKDDDPIFGSAKNSSFKPGVWGSHFGKSTPDAPAFSPITPATTSSYKPATTFNFTATPATTTPTPASGASVLSGGLTAGSYSKFDGMFGSRPTTPNPTDKESPAPVTSSGPVNHTWTAGSPIRFGETPEKAAAPKIALTAASPEKEGDTTPKAPAPSPFGSLFGTTPASTFKLGDTNSGFSFGAGKPDFLSAKKPFETASGLTSGISSRGTSPGLTDAESVQTDASDAMPPEPQANLSESRAGEENEDCLFEAKSKALKFITEEAAKGTKSESNTWETQGVGMFRLLRDKETGKCRVLFRAEPGGNIIVNANLLPTMEYASIPQGNSGAVKGPLYSDKKKTLERWVFKLKTKDMAAELEGLMKEHQKN